MHHFLRRTAVVLILFTSPAFAELKLPAIFGDHMVVQAGQPLPVWGTAAAGKTITVAFAGQSKAATAGDDGKWRVTLDPVDAAAAPLEMKITGDGEKTFADVLAGEVWLCSGQSNMGMVVAEVTGAKEAIAAATVPAIRLFKVDDVAKDEPQADLVGKWEVCTPASVRMFSAVGYFFGRQLHDTLKTPVGLIDSSWGGTTAEAWTPQQTLQANAILSPIMDRYAEAKARLPQATAEYETKMAEWRAKVDTTDPGNGKEAEGWAGQAFDDAQWRPHGFTAFRERMKKEDGAVWFRRSIDVPADWNARDLRLSLGAIDDFDVTYFNGTQIGATGAEEKDAAKKWRTYKVPGGLVKPGAATIAVRIFDRSGGGSFGTADETITLAPYDSPPESRINISNQWRTADEWTAPQKSPYPETPREPLGPDTSRSPGNLYNAMIHPLVGYAIRGTIWYQGESNAARAEQYRTLLPAMVEAWRGAWDQPTNKKFPFYIVQLAGFYPPSPRPVEPAAWPEIREAMDVAARVIGNSGVAVAIDIGDAKDIHPRNKLDVAKRLAALALHHTYGQSDVVPSGPIYRAMTVDGDKVTLTFDHAAGLKIAKGDALGGFAVAGEDRIWHAAAATIEGDRVVVRSEAVAAPVAVRYAWANNPTTANLQNAANLPAGPFRTDDWPGVTDGKR